jgi:hypothetical protein
MVWQSCSLSVGSGSQSHCEGAKGKQPVRNEIGTASPGPSPSLLMMVPHIYLDSTVVGPATLRIECSADHDAPHCILPYCLRNLLAAHKNQPHHKPSPSVIGLRCCMWRHLTAARYCMPTAHSPFFPRHDPPVLPPSPASGLLLPAKLLAHNHIESRTSNHNHPTPNIFPPSFPPVHR